MPRSLAIQQANVIAAVLAAKSTADDEVPPVRRVLWWSPAKLFGRYLTPCMVAQPAVAA